MTCVGSSTPDLAAAIYDAPGPDAAPELLRQRRRRVRDALAIMNRTAAWGVQLGLRDAAVRRARARGDLTKGGADCLDQPAQAAQRRDQAALRCRGDLPQ
ncbi:hypothetical protein JKG68_22190 [Microvirga aerilata]|uniref:Uncharacterized protein n=1 Tax=Microvirga aerilata TaxID=670292 RepID=A0A937D3Q5_9HYPH|nr:hypothetical protein [Microvirga aerilata]MBL0406665.1 hypothetical protein [Microvirga aerilata]